MSLFIVPTLSSHWPSLWSIITSYPKAFPDLTMSMSDFFTDRMKSCLTIYKDSDIIGGIGLDNMHTPEFADINIVTVRHSLTPSETSRLLRLSLKYFFSKHIDLQMIGANIKDSNRACKFLGLSMGGVKTHKLKSGYLYGSILREAVV